MREREKTAARHQVTGIRVGAAHLEVQQAPENPEEDHHQRAYQQQRRQISGGGVESDLLDLEDARNVGDRVGQDAVESVVEENGPTQRV